MKPSPTAYTLNSAFKKGKQEELYYRKKKSKSRSRPTTSLGATQSFIRVKAGTRFTRNSYNKTSQETIEVNMAAQAPENTSTFTTFGVGRNAFKKVVSHTTRNFGEPHDVTTPGPTKYTPKLTQDIGPMCGTIESFCNQSPSPERIRTPKQHQRGFSMRARTNETCK